MILRRVLRGAPLLALRSAGAVLMSSGRLPYKHTFHAGSGVDCFKHIVVTALLARMSEKETPWVYAETHAGCGQYDLDSQEALALREHESGVELLLARRSEPMPRAVTDFLEAQREAPRKYLGSAALAARAVRAGDRAVLFERDAETAARLEAFCERERARGALIETRIGCGYRGLAAATTELSGSRGLVVVDPPYQDGSDSAQSARLLAHLRTHWRAARVALWYPNADDAHERTALLKRLVSECELGEVLVVELAVVPAVSSSSEHLDDETKRPRLQGSGFLIVQPPYRFDEELREMLPRLGQLLAASSEDTLVWDVSWLA